MNEALLASAFSSPTFNAQTLRGAAASAPPGHKCTLYSLSYFRLTEVVPQTLPDGSPKYPNFELIFINKLSLMN